MTREEILEQYDVDKHGHIITLGKFQTEMVYVPHFYMLDDCETELTWNDGTTSFTFLVTPQDRVDWPEINKDTYAIHIHERDNGFVDGEELTELQHDQLMDKYQAETEDADEDDDADTDE